MWLYVRLNNCSLQKKVICSDMKYLVYLDRSAFPSNYMNRKMFTQGISRMITLLIFAIINCSNSHFIYPDLQVHDVTSSLSITLGCKVLLPPNIAAPIRMFIETYGDSNLQTQISFYTNHATNDSCTNSMHIYTSFKGRTEYLASSIINIKRYINSYCYIDGNGVPSREIIIQIKPVTNFDFTHWRCVTEMSNGTRYTSAETQGNLLNPYGVYYESRLKKYNQQFNLSIQLDRHHNVNGYLPLTCKIDNTDTTNSDFFVPNVRHFPQQPFKPFKFKLQNANQIYNIDTDMYGRLSNELMLPSKEMKVAKCPFSSQYETTCLNKEYIQSTGSVDGNLLLDTTQCFNFTLIAAPNLTETKSTLSDAVYVRTLFDFGAEFDTKCAFQEQTIVLPKCLSYPQHAANSIEIKDKVILEVPTAFNYHCFPLFNTHMSYILRTKRDSPNLGRTFQNVYTHMISLCPDAKLITDLYREIIDGMKYYRYMDVKYIQQPPINHKPSVTLQCGNTSSAKLIYISSGSCMENPSLWCGKKGGEYSVKTEILEDGKEKVIEKKTRIGGQENHNHIMTCLWRMYFCFVGSRVDNMPPTEIVLVENKSVNLTEPVKLGKTTGYNILPNECPYGEKFLDSMEYQYKYNLLEIKNRTINIKEITNTARKNLYNITYLPTDFLHMRKNVSLQLLNDTCPCRTHPTICYHNYTKGDLFFMNLPFSQAANEQHNSNISIWCEAFNQKSKMYSLSQLATEYLCSNDASDAVVRLGSGLLPEPYIEMFTHDNNKNLIVSCRGIPKQCLSTSSPIVFMIFWNKHNINRNLLWTMDNRQSINESSEVCVSTEKSWHCNTLTQNDKNFVSLPPRKTNYLPSISMSIKKSFLNTFTHVKCSYALGLKNSKTYSIGKLQQTALDRCTVKDYEIYITKGSNDAIVCDVSYNENGGICQPPTVTLLLKYNETILNTVTCDPTTTQNDTRCAFLTHYKKASATVFHNNSMKDVTVFCSYSGVSTAEKTHQYKDIPDHCTTAPTTFTPNITVDYTDNQTLTVACKYPDTYVNMCQYTSYTELDLRLEISSLFQGKKYTVLAGRDTLKRNITCLSPHKNINCSVGNPPNLALLTVSFPYTLDYFAHKNKYKVYCLLRKHQQRSTKISLNAILKKWTEMPLRNKQRNKQNHTLGDTGFGSGENKQKIRWPHKSITIFCTLLLLCILFLGSVKLYIYRKKKLDSKEEQNKLMKPNIYSGKLPCVKFNTHEDCSFLNTSSQL